MNYYKQYRTYRKKHKVFTSLLCEDVFLKQAVAADFRPISQKSAEIDRLWKVSSAGDKVEKLIFYAE